MDAFWLIPLIPFAGALLNGLFGSRWGMKASALVANLAVLASFVLAMIALFGLIGMEAGHRTIPRTLYSWMSIGSFHVDIAFLMDPLSAVMTAVVTGVGFLIHVYSRGYMEEDPGAWRYFAYLNLFMGSMLVLVLADNLLLLFLGWEGVGLCSYLLIGFWYEKKSATDAGKKAFIVNRVGDFGFLLGMLLLFATLGTLKVSEINHLAPEMLTAGGGVVTAIALLLFVGATGKSAQIPLFVWLPDAMEGPTPVSALIHAATMVTAGVYMVARMSAVFVLAPTALFWMAVIGCVTALFAATIGLAQDDIKRVLAYSTISQLGYMFLGCGVGAFSAGIFHVMTHAFFKALLFLGSGAVIHSMHHEQNIWKMGGLREHIPATYRTFLVACIAIAGIPPLAGFFSKDEILWKTFASGRTPLYVLGLVTAGLTAFYMFRLLYVTFFGKIRAPESTAKHIQIPSKWMTVPLVILAVFSVIGGWVGIPIVDGGNRIGAFLNESIASVDGGHHAPVDHAADSHAAGGHGAHDVGLEIGLMILSVAVAIGGIFLAYHMYMRRPGMSAALRRSPIGRLVARKYLVDEFNNIVWVRSIHGLALGLWRGFDVFVIDGLVNGSGYFMSGVSHGFRRLQNGQTQAYLVSLVLGSAAVLAYLVLR